MEKTTQQHLSNDDYKIRLAELYGVLGMTDEFNKRL